MHNIRQEIYIPRERYVTRGDEGSPCCTKEGGKLAEIHEFQMGRAESPRDPFRGSFPHVWNIVGQTGFLPVRAAEGKGNCGRGGNQSNAEIRAIPRPSNASNNNTCIRSCAPDVDS